jgi:hypothetical protein
MSQLRLIRSNTFRWASAVAGVFAAFIVILFGFIYWKSDRYLITRSDRMITQQIDFVAVLPFQRRIDAIADHLAQDSRGVQFAGLFEAGGNRLAGNLQQVPGELRIDGPVQTVRVPRSSQIASADLLIRAIGRRLQDGDVLVIGRNVDEAREISQVVGEALALGLVPASAFAFWKEPG